MDIYDMGNMFQAFGIFSRFRNEDRPGGMGFDSSLDGRSSFFYKGKYFVMLYATESKPDLLRQCSITLASKILDPSSPYREISYFTKNSLKPGSIQYFPGGLLGRKYLGRGFQGTYADKVEVEDKVKDKNKAKTEDKEFKLFIAVFKNSQEAINALNHFRDDLAKKRKVYQFESNTLRGEDDGRGKVLVAQRGAYLLGAIGFGKKETKIRMAEFMKNIK